MGGNHSRSNLKPDHITNTTNCNVVTTKPRKKKHYEERSTNYTGKVLPKDSCNRHLNANICKYVDGWVEGKH